jgi:hypothetical protein
MNDKQTEKCLARPDTGYCSIFNPRMGPRLSFLLTDQRRIQRKLNLEKFIVKRLSAKTHQL